MTQCPNCQKPVDPIRSRHVSVREGKVVAYCSAECLATAQTQPVRVPAATPAPTAASTTDKAVPAPMGKLESEPVIQILHEPASGVVTSAPDKRASSPVAVTAADDKAETDKKAGRPETKAEKNAADREKKASEKRAAEQKAAVEAKPETKAGAKPEAKAEAKAEPKPAAEKPVSPAALADAAASQPKRKRNRRDSIDARSAFDWIDDEPAEPVGRGKRAAAADDEAADTKPAGKGMQVVFVVGLVGVMAVGGYFIYDRFMKPAPASAPRVPADAASLIENVVRVDPDAGAAIAQEDPAVILERAVKHARTILQDLIKTSTSEQVKEKAAIALARTKDAMAIAWLADALPRAGTDAKKLEIAYALARAGDPRGRDALVATKGSGSRDARLDAGQKLAQLADKEAPALLGPLLSLPQHRYAVARALAPYGDKKAVDHLKGMLYDNDESKVRGALGLAFASKAKQELATGQVVSLVEGVLTTTDDKLKGYRHEASLVLAEIGNEKARPVLVENLRTQATLTEVSRALRRLDPTKDLSAHVHELENGLMSEKDLEQIKAAEAILILAGDAGWSERP